MGGSELQGPVGSGALDPGCFRQTGPREDSAGR